jgi:hypothetical protein
MGTCETPTQIVAYDGGHQNESLDAAGVDEEVHEEGHL